MGLKRNNWVIVMLLTALLFSIAGNVGAINLGNIIRVGGMAVVIDKFGGQINNFVNTITANKNAGTKEATAVVPILSIGDSGYIGAAQIIGTKANVKKCKAVVQIEGRGIFGANIRAKALVPVGSKTTSKIKRIYGVGVSAIIDIKI